MNCLASNQDYENNQEINPNGMLEEDNHVLSKHVTLTDVNARVVMRSVPIRDKTATILSQTEKFPEFISDVIDDIERFSLFPEGWDGDRAPRIKTDALLAALSLAIESYKWSPEKPHIVPSVDGGIALSWLIDEGNTEIEAEINDEGKIFIYSSDEADEDKPVLPDASPKQAVKWLISQCR